MKKKILGGEDELRKMDDNLKKPNGCLRHSFYLDLLDLLLEHVTAGFLLQ